MENNYTKGPWELSDSTTIISQDHRNVIAECCGYKNPEGVRAKYGCREHNARLIATAPDLLEACQRAFGWLRKAKAEGIHLNCESPHDLTLTIEQVGSAIYKATSNS